MKLREGETVSGTVKRTLFPSIDELQLVYSCAAFLAVSQVTKQNETFSGHHHDVKEFWGSLGELHGQKSLVGYSMGPQRPSNYLTQELWGNQLLAFWIPFFNPQTWHSSSQRQISTANVHSRFHLLSPGGLLCDFVFQIKKIWVRAMESWIIEVWGGC